MPSPLGDIFRHNRWANLQLLDFCAGLSDEQLSLQAPGTYGTVRDTLSHLAGAESRYVAALNEVEGARFEAGPFPGIAALRESLASSGDALERFAEGGLPSELAPEVHWGKTWHIQPTHFLLQAINHATEHRSHVIGILTQNGLTPPGLDGWAYGTGAGLIRTEE
ncbi:MAG TPA: DinB family protein [Chloroflexota bacterium]|nr:DinB family protein [Chloroflexota bacterium]